MKKLLLLSFTIFSLTNLIAQPSFTNRNDLIDNNYNGYTSITVDMNSDYLDDFVRVSENGVGIDYQQADGTFESVFISMIIQWVPDWSAAFYLRMRMVLILQKCLRIYIYFLNEQT